MTGTTGAIRPFHRLSVAYPHQWLYLLGDDGVVYSETHNRFVGLNAAAVSAYQAFDAGATMEELRSFSSAPDHSSTWSEGFATIYALSQGLFPAGEPRLEWSLLQQSLTANLEIHDVPVLVEFPTAPFEELCRDYFRNCPRTTKQARCHVYAKRTNVGWTIYVNDCPILSSLRDEQLGLGFLHAARSLLYAESRYDAAFHAATVAGDGCGVFLGAPREAGKSTLAAYLVSQGFDLLTDEPALLSLDTGCITSLPLPVSLKEPSWIVLGNKWTELALAPVHIRSDGTKIRLLHPPSAKHPRPSPLTHIVFPQYQPSCAPCVERLSPLRTLCLLDEAGTILAPHLSRDKFEAFLKMICSIPAYSLRYASLQEAASIIGSLTSA